MSRQLPSAGLLAAGSQPSTALFFPVYREIAGSTWPCRKFAV